MILRHRRWRGHRAVDRAEPQRHDLGIGVGQMGRRQTGRFKHDRHLQSGSSGALGFAHRCWFPHRSSRGASPQEFAAVRRQSRHRSAPSNPRVRCTMKTRRAVLLYCWRCTDASLWRSLFRGIQSLILDEACLQPFPQNFLIHRCVGNKPLMADIIKASGDVCVQYPFRADIPR